MARACCSVTKPLISADTASRISDCIAFTCPEKRLSIFPLKLCIVICTIIRMEPKRIVVEVTPDIHAQLKKNALSRDCSIKNVVLTALEKSGAIRYQPEGRSRSNERS